MENRNHILNVDYFIHYTLRTQTVRFNREQESEWKSFEKYEIYRNVLKLGSKVIS